MVTGNSVLMDKMANCLYTHYGGPQIYICICRIYLDLNCLCMLCPLLAPIIVVCLLDPAHLYEYDRRYECMSVCQSILECQVTINIVCTERRVVS